MAGNETKIDTKLFAATADTFATVTKELGRLVGDAQKQINSLRSSWQGDTSDDVKNTGEQLMKSAADLLQALGGYAPTLREIAGIYDKTEQNIQETGKTLKFNKGMR